MTPTQHPAALTKYLASDFAATCTDSLAAVTALGPNWLGVLSFWSYLDTLTPAQWVSLGNAASDAATANITSWLASRAAASGGAAPIFASWDAARLAARLAASEEARDAAYDAVMDAPRRCPRVADDLDIRGADDLDAAFRNALDATAYATMEIMAGDKLKAPKFYLPLFEGYVAAYTAAYDAMILARDLKGPKP